MVKTVIRNFKSLIETLKPVRIPDEIRNYVSQICRMFGLDPLILRVAYAFIRRYGSDVFYSSRNPKGAAAGLVKAVIDVALENGWYHNVPPTREDLADQLGINPATITQHKKHVMYLVRKFGKQYKK